MAKELHIKIDKQIGGLFIDDMGWLSAGYSAAELEFALSEMPEPKRLIIHGSSIGGDVFQGFEIYNRLQDLKKRGTEIHFINEAKAFSILSYIAMAASPGKLQARKSSLWNAHKPSAVPSEYNLNSDQLRKYAAQLDSIENILISAYVARTGMSESKVRDYLREDMIINADQALEQGWIDAIIEDEPIKEVAIEPAKMLAWKPMAFLPKEKIDTELPQTINNKETEIMAEQPKDAGFVAKVKAFAMEILNMKPEGEETPEQPEQPEVIEVPETPEQSNQPDPKDAELEQLRAELAAERAQKEEALTALNTANDAMVHMKTTFVPQARQNNFRKEGDKKDGGEGLSLKERMQAEKEARKAK